MKSYLMFSGKVWYPGFWQKWVFCKEVELAEAKHFHHLEGPVLYQVFLLSYSHKAYNPPTGVIECWELTSTHKPLTTPLPPPPTMMDKDNQPILALRHLQLHLWPFTSHLSHIACHLSPMPTATGNNPHPAYSPLWTIRLFTKTEKKFNT